MPKNLGGHVTLATPLLENFLGVVSGLSLGRLVSNLKSVALTVFELLALTPIDRPLRTHTHTHTDRHTSNEHIISAIHFVHLAEIKTDRSHCIDQLSVEQYPHPKSVVNNLEA